MFIEEPQAIEVPIFSKEFTNCIHDVYINGEIYSNTTAYSNLLDKLRFATQNEMFRIYINCGGGCFYTTMQIMNAMRDSEATIVTIADGMVASAASMIFLNGDELEVKEHSVMLIHCPSYELGGKGHDVIKLAKFNDFISKQNIHDIYGGFLSEEEIEQVINGQDFWLSSNDIMSRLEKFVQFKDAQAQKMLDEETKKFEEETKPVEKKKSKTKSK